MIAKFIICLLLTTFLTINYTPQVIADFSYSFQTSLYTQHWTPRDYHNNNQGLIGIEYYHDENKLKGLSYFQNSYDQSTWYIYSGKIYELTKIKGFNVNTKLTYGIVHGYDDEDGTHNAWMNQMGTFPAIVGGLIIKKNSVSMEFIPFGDAGFIITTGIFF